MIRKYLLTAVVVMASAVLLAGIAVQFVSSQAMAQAGQPAAVVAPSADVGTSFVYQGYLEQQSGAPVEGSCDFEFRLFDAAAGGSQADGLQSRSGHAVSQGRFTAELDFGANAFDGQGRWLEIRVRCPSGSGNYATLVPRQPLTGAPYALSLRPGATVNGSSPAGILNLTNNGSGSGISVSKAGDDGLFVCATGANTTCSPLDSVHNGVEVGNAEDSGLLVSDAGGDGVIVFNAGGDGVYVETAGEDGLRIGSAGSDGLEIIQATDDGVRVRTVGGDGMEVESAGQNGGRVISATDSGVRVGSADTGVQVDSATRIGVAVGSAPTGVVISSATTGVFVGSAGDDGLDIAAGDAGLRVRQAGGDGVTVEHAAQDGLYVCATGSNTDCTPLDNTHNGVEVGNAEDLGLLVDRAGQDGVWVRAADDDGMVISIAGQDGVRVNFADDGIQLGGEGSFPAWGLFTPSPGVPNTALLVQTANANGEWALSTQDKISAANVTTNSQTLVAVAASDATLERGNLVAAAGLAPAVPENQYPLPLVRLSTGQERAGIVGVVEGRMALEPAPDKEGELILHSVAGPAKAGDYVAITVLGVARAKIAPDTETQPGQRLTVGQQPGTTRALRTTQVDGMTVDEGGPSLGMALE